MENLCLLGSVGVDGVAVLCGAKGRGKAVFSLQRQCLGTQLLEKKRKRKRKRDLTSKDQLCLLKILLYVS